MDQNQIQQIKKLRLTLQEHPISIADKINKQFNYIKNKQIKVKSTQDSIAFLYIPYNSDQINDTGWGCAWRCIQMMLSSYLLNDIPNFEILFSYFGSKIFLEMIYLTKNKIKEIPQYLKTAIYIPQELNNGWAEPFIGNLILYYFGLNSELFLINSYPQYANAPKEVFERTLNFHEFYLLLNQHFKNYKSPVMIDDSQYASVIYGIKILETHGNQQKILYVQVIIFIADPHISSNLESEQIGLYQIYLDFNGNQIKFTIPENEQNQYLYVNSYKGLHFNQKPWMVTFAKDDILLFNDWKQILKLHNYN